MSPMSYRAAPPRDTEEFNYALGRGLSRQIAALIDLFRPGDPVFRRRGAWAAIARIFAHIFAG